MTQQPRDVEQLAQALREIAVYAEGMTRHCEQQGFGEARSWRMIVHHARQALGGDGLPAPSVTQEPVDRAPADKELERLIKRCRLQRAGDTEWAVSAAEAHEFLDQLANELLLWRHGHPFELPGEAPRR